jgi:hypothetical protein
VSTAIEKPNQQKQHGESGGFVIGYLNLFSDAVVCDYQQRSHQGCLHFFNFVISVSRIVVMLKF